MAGTQRIEAGSQSPGVSAVTEADFQEAFDGVDGEQVELRAEFESLRGQLPEAVLEQIAQVGSVDANCRLRGESGREASEPLGWMVPDFAQAAAKKLRECGVIKACITNDKGEKVFFAFLVEECKEAKPVSALESVLERLLERIERIEMKQDLGGGGGQGDTKFRAFQERLMDRAFEELTADPFERLEKASKMTSRMRELGGKQGESFLDVVRGVKEIAPEVMEMGRMYKNLRKPQAAIEEQPKAGEVPEGQDPFAKG